MVGVNSFGLNYLVQSLPFGGVGASGYGRFSGKEGLRECCHVRAVVSDALERWPIAMPVPAPIAYPVAPSAPAYVSGLLAFLFAHDLAARTRGVWRLVEAERAK